MSQKIGVLLTNLGTPSHPDTASVRTYLREFLGDSRVVEFKPRWLWWCILNGIILPIRAKKSAKLYQAIWQDSGSPLLSQSQAIAEGLQKALGEQYHVVLGMRYGAPSLKEAMLQLKNAKLERLVVLPLYPQYSATTTATTFDKIAELLQACRSVPSMHFIKDYHAHPLYIQALAQSVRDYWQQQGQAEKLVMSFHGLPQEYVDKGDPYQAQCQRTAEHLAQALNLEPHQWCLTFQSRFGPKAWLQPYTDDVLAQFAQDGIQSVNVICPGFAVDCLETLEEIAIQSKSLFLEQGGQSFGYIPCLNDGDLHLQLLQALVVKADGA